MEVVAKGICFDNSFFNLFNVHIYNPSQQLYQSGEMMMMMMMMMMISPQANESVLLHPLNPVKRERRKKMVLISN